MPYPGSCSNTAKIDTIDTVVDGIETHVHATETTVGTINTNVSNLAPAYGNQSVAPDNAAGADIVAAGAWTLGDYTANIIAGASNVTIIGIHLYSINAPGTFQVNLYYGTTKFCSAVFSLAEVAVVNRVYIPVRSQKITGDIRAKLESAAGGSETAKIKLIYV